MARGTVISISAQILRLLIQLTGSVVLARLLTPADFGLVAMATTVVGFVGLFSDFGLSTATIQRKELDFAVTNVLFTINILAGLGLMIVATCSAPLAAWFYGNSKLTLLILALSVPLPIYAMGAQHSALLSRELRWTTVNVISVASQFSGLVIAVFLAWQTDIGYWALAAQGVVCALVSTVLLWTVQTWRPSLVTNWKVARSEITFGLELTGTSLLNYFHRQLDNVLIGWRWGETELGYYNRAYNLLLLPLTLISGPIASVMIPILSRCQETPAVWRRHFIAAFSIILYAGYFIGAVFISNADSIIHVVLGTQWAEAIPIFKYLSISIFAASPMNAMGWIYISIGRTQSMLYWTVFSTLIVMLSFAVGLPYRAEGLALAYSVSVCLLLVPCILFGVRYSPVTAPTLLRMMISPLASAILAIGVTLLVAINFNKYHVLFQLVAGVSITTTIYGGAALSTMFFDPSHHILWNRLVRFASSGSADEIVQDGKIR